jgi:hypothetical protein
MLVSREQRGRVMVKSKRRKFDDGGPVPGTLDQSPAIVSARKTTLGRTEGPVPETAISRRLPPGRDYSTGAAKGGPMGKNKRKSLLSE